MKLSIVVHPNAKKPKVIVDAIGTVQIYVKESPFHGKANEAVREAVASYFHTKKGSVTLLHGEKSK